MDLAAIIRVHLPDAVVNLNAGGMLMLPARSPNRKRTIILRLFLKAFEFFDHSAMTTCFCQWRDWPVNCRRLTRFLEHPELELNSNLARELDASTRAGTQELDPHRQPASRSEGGCHFVDCRKLPPTENPDS
jgi:hypothetical protein